MRVCVCACLCACVCCEVENQKFCFGQVSFEMNNKLDMRDVRLAREDTRGEILSLGFTSTYMIFSLGVSVHLGKKRGQRGGNPWAKLCVSSNASDIYCQLFLIHFFCISNHFQKPETSIL